MRKEIVFLISVFFIALVLAGCAKLEKRTQGPALAQPSIKQPSTPVATSELENELNSLDKIDSDIDLSQLDSLDSDLALVAS